MAYGSITQRGDKYRVCFDYGIDREGNRVRKYRTFDTKRDATRAFNEHKVKMDKGTQVLPSEYTFAQWLDYWYKDIILPQIEETTAYGYRGMIENYLKPQLGEIRLQKLTARDIQQYYTWLMGEKELSPNTVIKHHNLLTNTLNAAERQEYITKNPMRAVSPPKKRQREAKFYTPEQLGILLDKAVGTRLELPVFICAAASCAVCGGAMLTLSTRPSRLRIRARRLVKRKSRRARKRRPRRARFICRIHCAIC